MSPLRRPWLPLWTRWDVRGRAIGAGVAPARVQEQRSRRWLELVVRRDSAVRFAPRARRDGGDRGGLPGQGQGGDAADPTLIPSVP
ncbi:MAG TPA: hypothetical protein VE465_09400, partial [Streptosporangiaceae bacterium]|nr:hypothetical protein [Streptosporangiaceae bacterium]